MTDIATRPFTPAPWTEHAACADMGPDIFFDGTTRSNREAKAVCADCPVKQACLNHAMAVPERFGIWGGLDERQRRRMRKWWRPNPKIHCPHGHEATETNTWVSPSTGWRRCRECRRETEPG